MSSIQSNFFVTGATGFLGRHFLLQLARLFPDADIVALVRGQSLATATTRLHEALRSASESCDQTPPRLDRVSACLGDLTKPNLGVDAETCNRIKNTPVTAVFHIAASLEFNDTNRQHVLALNVGGTKHALSLARHLEAQRFVYVSTAYSCGRTTGLVPAKLHSLRGAFNNVYEYSKCRAEHVVARACRRWDMPWSVWRPSIIVGPIATYTTGGSETGLYGFVREMLRMRRCLNTTGANPRLLGEATCRVNLVPVDAVASRMVEWVCAGFPGPNVRHLTSPNAPSVATVIGTVAEECGVQKLAITREPLQDLSPLQRLLDTRMSFYSSYLVEDKFFAGGDVLKEGVSRLALRRFVRASLAERSVLSTTNMWRAARLRSPDGHVIRAFDSGNPDGKPLVIVNAVGVAHEMFEPMRRDFAARYRLITWECRGMEPTSSPLSDSHTGIECHVRDLEQVAAHYGLSQYHLMGYCTGADVALQAAQQLQNKVLSLCLLNGAFIAKGGPQTTFQRSLWAVAPQLAHSLERAALHHRLLYGISHCSDKASQRWHDLAGELDPSLLHLINSPFETADALHRYAKLLAGFQTASTTDSRVQCPTLMLTGEQDRITHPATTVEIARELQASCKVFSTLGHFAVYTSEDFRRAIEVFIDGSTSEAAKMAA